MKYDLDISYEGDVYVTFTERINLDGDSNWLLGSLNKPIIYNQHNIDKILVYTENENLTDILRIVPSNKTITSESDTLSKFERVNWMMIA